MHTLMAKGKVMGLLSLLLRHQVDNIGVVELRFLRLLLLLSLLATTDSALDLALGL